MPSSQRHCTRCCPPIKAYRLPTCLLDSRYMSVECIQPETVLESTELATILERKLHQRERGLICRQRQRSGNRAGTHPGHLEITQDTSASSPLYASVADLGRSGVGVHLREFQLRARAYPLRERGVADDVSKGLSRKILGTLLVRLTVRLDIHWNLERRRRVQETGSQGSSWRDHETYLSDSYWAKTLRLV